MTLNEALTLLKFRLGSRTDADLDIIIPVEMAQAQFELEHSGQPPWFLLSEDTMMATTAGERRLSVPGDFLLEADEDTLWLLDPDTGEPKGLTKGEFDSSIAYWGNTNGRPAGYALAGQYFHLFPIPDAVYTIRMKYYAADTAATALTPADTNLWLTRAADLLLARTGRRMASYLRDLELAQVFASEEQIAVARMLTEQTAREEANRIRTKGN